MQPATFYDDTREHLVDAQVLPPSHEALHASQDRSSIQV